MCKFNLQRLLLGFLLCTFAAFGTRTMADDNAPQQFPDKTQWDLVGDSITEIGMYGFYVGVYYQTRFPSMSFKVFNCGIPGETAEMGLKRYSWDMAANNPTVASIMFGMNDVNRWLYKPENQGSQYDSERDAAVVKWAANTKSIIELFKKDNVPVILIEPSIFDQTSTMAAENAPGVNDGLGKIATACIDIAHDENIQLVDFYHPMLELNKRVQATDPAATIIGPDRVHPGNAGHLYMAYLFLTAQHVPTEIAHMTIDGMSGQVTDSGNCTVSKVSADQSGVTFTYLAKALPFPIDPSAADAIKWEPQINDLNKEILTIPNLTAGTYQLEVDGQKIRTYTSDELKAGVNLGVEAGMPQYKQALKVMGDLQSSWGSGYVLRAIASVEAWAPDLPRPVTLDQMGPVLDAKLKENPDLADTIAKYRQYKPDEEKTKGDVNWSIQNAVADAVPTAHVFKITPVTK
jgi:lysophospholipase L1-like esterase